MIAMETFTLLFGWLSYSLYSFVQSRSYRNLGKPRFSVNFSLTINPDFHRSFDWGFTSLSRIFHTYGELGFTDKGLQILTYTLQSWQ